VADNFPSPPTPESGEQQYRRWVEHLKSNVRAKGAGTTAAGGTTPGSAASGAAAAAGADAAGAKAGSGDATLVMDSWFVDDSTPVEKSVLPRPIVTVSQSQVEAAPGQPVRLKVTVRNVGPVVETYTLAVVGPEGSWLSVVPNEISLFPGAEGSAALMIKPGRTSKLPAGDYVVGVMARSEVDPHESTVAEVTIMVTPFFDSNLGVSRTTIDIRQRATTFAQITNNGNSFVDFRLDLTDPDGYLRFKVDEPAFTLGPGETVWKKISVSAPLHLFGTARTLSMVATLLSLRDRTTGMPLVEVRPSIQRVTLVQRAAIRLRLGILGRILLLLLIVGLIAVFFLSRSGITGKSGVTAGPPPPPQGLTVQLYEGNQALLLWDAAPGAQGYSIYAVGSTGNALMAASPSPSAVASATSSPAASASATSTATANSGATASPAPTPSLSASASVAPSAASSAVPSAAPSVTPASAPASISAAASVSLMGDQAGTLRIVTASVRTSDVSASSASRSPSPSPSASASPLSSPASSTAATGQTVGDAERAENDIESPSCGDCTHVADVPSGTTRYIVTKTMPGQQNCYRIIAMAGQASSLYTPRECVDVPAATGTSSGSSSSGDSGSDGSSGASGATDTVPNVACPPYDPLASALSTTSIAITWLPPSEYKEPAPKSKTQAKGRDKGPAKPRLRDKPRDRMPRGEPRSIAAVERSGLAAVPFGGGPSPDSGSGSTPTATCNAQLPVTGFELQRQLLDGWTTISPTPGASDTAVEVSGLQAGVKYCFRMRSLASPTPSAYTKNFCRATKSDSSSNSSSGSSSSPTPTPAPTSPAAPTDPAGGTPAPAAAIIIEGVL
jgi:hypothetical protein